jgi:hypothetical protein
MSENSYEPKFLENMIGYVVLLVIFIGVLFKMYTIYGQGVTTATVSRAGSNVVFSNTLGTGELIFETISENIIIIIISLGIIGAGLFVAYNVWLWHKKAGADADLYAKSEKDAAGRKCGLQPGSSQGQVSLGDENKVFHIPNQIFEYSEADKVCKSLTVDSKGTLATVEQMKNAWENDKANWCSYGWTKGGYALYPVQPEYFNRIQNQEKCKYNCGNSPGVKGGKILLDKNTETNKNKFGINCYGKLKNDEIDIKKGREYSIPCEGPKDKLKTDITYDDLEIIVGSNIFNQKKHS